MNDFILILVIMQLRPHCRSRSGCKNHFSVMRLSLVKLHVIDPAATFSGQMHRYNHEQKEIVCSILCSKVTISFELLMQLLLLTKSM